MEKNPSRKKKFLKQPQYKGGKKALDEFITKNLQYPQDALDSKVEGAVVIAYDINEKGDVIRASVTNGIGYGCDEEALRLVKMLKYQGVYNLGVNVTSHLTITIHFRLSQALPQDMPLTPTFMYSYVPSSNIQESVESEDARTQNEKHSFTYTITLKS
jgi:protein TonB